MPTKRPTKKKTNEATAVTLTVDGEDYVVDLTALGPHQARALRNATGMSLRKVMEFASEDMDIDILVALMWLARFQAGDDVAFKDLEDSVTYESDISVATSASPPEA